MVRLKPHPFKNGLHDCPSVRMTGGACMSDTVWDKNGSGR